MPSSLLSAAKMLALALEWLKLDLAMKAAKKAEAAKRAELVASCFPAGLGFGTNTFELTRGYAVKAVVRPSPKVDPKTIDAALASLRKLGRGAGKLLAGRLIKFKPELAYSEWTKLSDEHRALFKGAVTIEASGAAVELVEPT